MTHPDQDSLQLPPTATSQAGRRRRFLGAGVAAAPLVLTMVSQPALGANCFTPSRSLSKNMSVSQQGLYGQCTGAESAGNYKAQQGQRPKGRGAYHWPDSVSPTDPFHPAFARGNSPEITLFDNADGSSKTLGEVLDINAGGMVAFHIIGAYLNKRGGNGAVIPDVAITEAGIKTIWYEYATKGYYAPMAGVEWDADDIVDYLKKNGIVG